MTRPDQVVYYKCNPGIEAQVDFFLSFMSQRPKGQRFYTGGAEDFMFDGYHDLKNQLWFPHLLKQNLGRWLTTSCLG